MTLAEKQSAMVERYQVIPDPQERLAIIIGHRSKLPPLPEDMRTPERRVEGCQSSVWIDGRIEDGVCRYQADSDSPLVRGLVVLLTELFDGAAPDDAATFHPTLLADLGIEKNLTPTRVNGMAQVAATLRRLAIHA
ncbi:MAG: SufE family protein [Chthoniobacterales bacterium]